MSRTCILQLIDSSGPGGAETVFAALAHRVQSSGYRSVAVHRQPNDYLDSQLEGIPSYTVRPAPMGGTRFINWDYVTGLRRVLAAERPGLIHAHSFDSALYAALALFGSPTRLVVTLHGEVDLRTDGWRDRVKWLVLRRADRIVAVSHWMVEAARATPGLPSRRLTVVRNGIDIHRFQPMVGPSTSRGRFRIGPKTIVIGALGNVRPPKAYDVLLRTMLVMRERGADVHLVIAGDADSDLGRELAEFAHSEGLSERVTFLGFVNDSVEFLRCLDIVVCSSRTEGLPLSILQAMATGLPTVATRCGGPQEIIEDGVSGLLVPTESPVALADALLRLIGDSLLRERLGRGGRERIANAFSVDSMIENYKRIYTDVLATNAVRHRSIRA